MTKKTFLPLLLCGLALSPVAMASDAAAPAAQAMPETSSALRVVRDQDTGQIRAATGDEQAAMARAESRASSSRRAAPATESLQMSENAEGMRKVRLTSEYLMQLNGERGADGRVVESHSDTSMNHPVANPTE